MAINKNDTENYLWNDGKVLKWAAGLGISRVIEKCFIHYQVYCTSQLTSALTQSLKNNQVDTTLFLLDKINQPEFKLSFLQSLIEFENTLILNQFLEKFGDNLYKEYPLLIEIALKKQKKDLSHILLSHYLDFIKNNPLLRANCLNFIHLIIEDNNLDLLKKISEDPYFIQLLENQTVANKNFREIPLIYFAIWRGKPEIVQYFLDQKFLFIQNI